VDATRKEPEKTGYIAPKISGVSMEDPAVPTLELPGPAAHVYLRMKTTADGVPKFDEAGGPVTVEVHETAQASTHHVRPSSAGGEAEGDYFFLLLETESNGGTPAAPVVKRRIPGNCHLGNQLMEIANAGGKRELYKGYLAGPDDKHEIRMLEQLPAEPGTGQVPVMKPLGEEEKEGGLPFYGFEVDPASPQQPVEFVEGTETNNLVFSGATESRDGFTVGLNVIKGVVAEAGVPLPFGGTFDLVVEFSTLSIDNSGPEPALVWSSPTELFRLYAPKA
jgi:hypothetical protein